MDPDPQSVSGAFGHQVAHSVGIQNRIDFALEACRDEYNDMLDSWRALDVKAQGLTAIAGIFLGGLFVLIGKAPSTYGPFLRILLVGSTLLLLTSFIGALSSLLVKPAKSAPGAEISVTFAKGFAEISDPDELTERSRMFYEELFDLWQETNTSLLSAIHQKGSRIRDAQISLLAAAVVLSLVTSGVILNVGGHHEVHQL